MQPARDFEASQSGVLRRLCSARSNLHKSNSSEDGENISAERARQLVMNTRPSMRPQSALLPEAGSENAAPEKPQAPTAPKTVFADATNRYCDDRLPSGKIVRDQPAVLEPRRRQAIPPTTVDASMGEEEVSAVQPSNAQHATEYVEDIFQALKCKESLQLISPTYMDRQVHVNAKMRGILFNWLVDVHKKYKMRAETLFLAVQLVDRYLEIQVTARSQLQLVGATALLIAAKFEEIHPPQIKEYEYITDNAYSRDEIQKMEVCILKALKFNICCPTAMHFVDRYHAVSGCSAEHRHLAQYLLELTLVEYKMLKYGPSHVAAACILLSNKLLRQPSWTSALVRTTEMTEPMLRECAKEMCVLLECAEASSLQAVRKKFSQVSYHSVAKLNFVSGHAAQAAANATRI